HDVGDLGGRPADDAAGQQFCAILAPPGLVPVCHVADAAVVNARSTSMTTTVPVASLQVSSEAREILMVGGCSVV
ncbi:MAG: hypothetical protein KJ734_04340, partial [Chloroflexi bacterium]|nr:hypothetical protein [Chloroflexota bacterium]